MNPNILIVDDDENSLRMSRTAMEALVDPGNIHCAQTAAETMAILSAERIHLAFLDIDMPDTSGFSIADYLRQNHPQVKYVFLTGYVDFAARSYDYEPMDFLTKPIDLMRLKKTLERYESRFQPAADYSHERIAVDTSVGFVLLAPSEISYIGKERRVVKLPTAPAGRNMWCATRWMSWSPFFPILAFSASINPALCPCPISSPCSPSGLAIPTRPCWATRPGCR